MVRNACALCDHSNGMLGFFEGHDLSFISDLVFSPPIMCVNNEGSGETAESQFHLPLLFQCELITGFVCRDFNAFFLFQCSYCVNKDMQKNKPPLLQMGPT